jgi:uncharacterized protein (DUF1330 family)
VADTPPDTDRITLCALLWAAPGRRDELRAYEDHVLALLADHGGALLARHHRTADRHDGDDDEPDEVHVIAFASSAALDGYRRDPRRAALDVRRDEVLARSQVFEVDGPATTT